MKKILIILGVFFLLSPNIVAQNSPIFFNDSISKRNVVGLNFLFENTLYTGISYDRIITVKEKNVNIGIEFGSPLYLISERNKRIAINTAVYLLKSDFNIRTQFGVCTNFYEDALSKGQFMDVSIGLFPGYYRPKYFIASEISYRNNLFTTFNFKDISPVQEDLILANTTGSFNFGLNGGVFIKRRLELKSRLFYNMPRNFKNHPPFTQNVGFSLGVNYWF